jgi:hypothetical protein
LQTGKTKFNILRSSELWSHPKDFLAKLNESKEIEFNLEHKEINLSEIVTETFQLVDFSWEVFKQLTPIIHRAEAMVQKLNWADTGLIINNNFRPILLNEKILSEMISSKNAVVDREYCVSVVGDLSTLASFINLFQRMGYKKINFYTRQDVLSEASQFAILAMKLFINLKVEVKPFDELTYNEELSSLLIVDAELDREKELFEDLSYFNFLSPNSIFLDFRSDINNLLQLEADKAELMVLDGREFFLKKYHMGQQMVANR